MVITSLAAGRNGIDSPVDPTFPNDQCVEAINVDFTEGPLGRKRGGSAALSLTGGTANTTGIRKLIRHMPGVSLATQELWSIDAAATPQIKRLQGGVVWGDIAPSDNIVPGGSAATVPLVRAVSFNGKLFLFYPSAVDRMHVFDGTVLRRMSLQTPTAAPTIANQGAGAYPATLRYYRVRWLHLVGVLIVRRSEPSATSASFTPSGAGASARVTRPAAPGESETHWEVEVSTDAINWYQLVSADGANSAAPVAIATTFYDDVTPITSYSLFSIAPISGLYTALPGCAMGVTDGNRLILGGNATSTARVWWTTVLGALNKADDERYLNTTDVKGYTDLNEKDGGGLTGMEGPINGVIFCFKYEQTWRLVPTGNPDAPYIARLLTRTLGNINAASTVLAEDSAGNPAVYFVSPASGVYRYSLVAGLEYMGRDVEDVWFGLHGKSAVNLNATLVSHAMYYPKLKQIWFWVSTGASNSPDTIMVLDIRAAKRKDRYGVRGGWSIFTGDIADASTGCMFSGTPGASMSLDLQPYVGRQSAVKILKTNTSDLNDDGTLFQGLVKTKNLVSASSLGSTVVMGESILIADVGAVGVNIRQSIFANFEAAPAAGAVSDVTLAPSAAETGLKVLRKFADGQASDIGVLQLQLGDSVAVAAKWSLDQLDVRNQEGGPL